MPVRISCRKDDAGYTELSRHARILLNGAEISHVITADEEQRMLLRYVTDAGGKPVLDLTTRKCRTEVRRGDVFIVIDDQLRGLITESRSPS